VLNGFKIFYQQNFGHHIKWYVTPISEVCLVIMIVVLMVKNSKVTMYGTSSGLMSLLSLVRAFKLFYECSVGNIQHRFL